MCAWDHLGREYREDWITKAYKVTFRKKNQQRWKVKEKPVVYVDTETQVRMEIQGK